MTVAGAKFDAAALSVVLLEDGDNMGRHRSRALSSTGIAFDSSLFPPAPYAFHLTDAVEGQIMPPLSKLMAAVP